MGLGKCPRPSDCWEEAYKRKQEGKMNLLIGTGGDSVHQKKKEETRPLKRDQETNQRRQRRKKGVQV